MKVAVVYKSKTGFVEKYAKWIAEELSADIFKATETTIDKLMAYDTIIYGGGLYVSGINGVKLIKNNLDKLKGKKVVVYASGATPPRKEALDEVISHNFTAEQQKKIKFFYLRGGFDYSKLALKDKILMTLLKWRIKGKSKLTADEKGMYAAYYKPVDFTKKKNIEALTAYVRS